MSTKRVFLQLDPTSSGVYFPGQTVSGSVVLNSCSRNVNYKELYVEVKGRAMVQWSCKDYTYHASESYLSLKIPLVKENSIFDQVTDRHYLPFSFIVPSGSPPSYEGKHGHVRYSIKVVARRRSFFSWDYNCTIFFSVQTTVNLTRDTMVPLKLSGYWAKSPENICGSIKVDAWLDKTAYIPGEKMQFNAKIENCSGQSVKQTIVQFIQYTIFTDRKRTHKTRKVLWEQRAGKIHSNNMQIWDKVPITVVSVPPTGLPCCDLINIFYIVKVAVDPGLFCPNLVIRMRVVVGTTRSPADQQQEINQENYGNSLRTEGVPLQSEDASWNDENYTADSPPPTYEDCELQGFTFPTFSNGNEKSC